MITLFAIPKTFEGQVATIQSNALESWMRLGPEVDVVLVGDDGGVAAAAAEVGARHLPGVATTEYGTPLLDSAFALARAASKNPLLAYVNADIILLPDFVAALSRIRFKSFLCVGRRWEVDIRERVDFGAGYEQRLRRLVASNGKLALPDHVDYFAFSRLGPLVDIPPFAVGRPTWDNWMIYRASSLGLPVVDATRVVTAIHQPHGYEHVPHRTGATWYGPEATANFALMEGVERFQTRHATHVLMRLGAVPAIAPRRIVSRVRSRHASRGSVEALARTAEAVLRRAFRRR